MKPQVGVFVPRVLERSMTFIDRQLRSYEAFEAVLIGVRPVQAYQSVDISVTTVSQYPSRRTLDEVLFRQFGYAPGFYRKLKTKNLSIMHGHFGWSLASLMHLKKRLGLPTVITFHGRDATLSQDALLTTRSGREYLKLLPVATRTVDRIIAVSDFTRNRLISSGWDSSKITTIYNGIDTKKFKPIEGVRESIVLGIGRFVEKKGFIYLLKASSILKTKGIAHKLVLIGDGPLESELRGVSTDLKLDTQFTGFIPTDEVRGWINRAAVLCVPSVTAADGDSEGLPTVILEAQAMETPAIATRHAGNAEALIHNKTGFLVQERDVAEMAHYLELIINNSRTRQELGKEARKLVEAKFDLHQSSKKIEDLYQSLLCGRVC